MLATAKRLMSLQQSAGMQPGLPRYGCACRLRRYPARPAGVRMQPWPLNTTSWRYMQCMWQYLAAGLCLSLCMVAFA